MPSLQPYHTFGLATSGQKVTQFFDVPSFIQVWGEYKNNYILGGGSNTVFLTDFEGQILVNNITGIEHTETPLAHELRVGAGENWHAFVTHCLNNGWYGLENLALIPGSVGASPIQNIGAYGVEVGNFISAVEGMYLDGNKKTFTLTKEECRFGYRDSIFKNELDRKVLITNVTFILPKDCEPVATYGDLASLVSPSPRDIYDEVIRIRKAKLPDPAELGNAGSFFKNPVISNTHYDTLLREFGDVPGFAVDEELTKVPAAWLIDNLGFKGKAVNAVRCHPGQPLVLTNTGGAKGSDLVLLAREIIAAVQEKFTIALEPEVRLVGKKGLIKL